jgi:serine/threonine protein kinase
VEQLPEFNYLERLGCGQFGVVYRCQSRLTREIRAVKDVALRDSGDIADWQAEAEALAACKNEHIVRIHHAAATSDGPVLVMDFLPGGDAERRWLPAGGAIGDVVDCLIDATWGLHHMHTAGLVHRDLKPANLLFDGRGARSSGTSAWLARRRNAPTSPTPPTFRRRCTVVPTGPRSLISTPWASQGGDSSAPRPSPTGPTSTARFETARGRIGPCGPSISTPAPGERCAP